MTEHRTSSNRGRGRQPQGRSDPPELLELRQELRELRFRELGLGEPRRDELGRDGGRAPRSPRRSSLASAPSRDSNRRAAPSSRSRRRRRLLLPAAFALIALVVVIARGSATSGAFPPPSRASLAGMSVGQRIVAFANSQLGYSTDPSNSYCNKFSAYWGAGSQTCAGSDASEEWCADFAAWAWRKAGVPFSYGFSRGDINAGAASFYSWGVTHGAWHSAYSDYRPRAGDVAVYGLSLGSGASPTAAHVAIVTGVGAARSGPDVINGDGDRTGFSVVEPGTDQLRADTGHGRGAPLAGYVSPD